VTCSERDRIKGLLRISARTLQQATHKTSSLVEDLSTEASHELVHLARQQESAHAEINGLRLALALHCRVHNCL
jgi:hypothetical protein